MLHTPEICLSVFWGIYGSLIHCHSHLLSVLCFRKVLEVGVLTWSLATALVPLLAGYMPGLILTRILVCKSLPNLFLHSIYCFNITWLSIFLILHFFVVLHALTLGLIERFDFITYFVSALAF